MTLGHIELASAEGAVILLLLFFSVLTWLIGLAKLVQFSRQKQRNRRFQRAFWQQESISGALAATGNAPGASANLARASLDAAQAVAGRAAGAVNLPDRIERALRQQIQRERRSLEAGLAVLASIGSTSPFIGLFGTVWGIMAALQEIGQTGSASLDTVAGPIGNALIATGVGIAVAVPAVLVYNYFIRRMKLHVAYLDDFAHDIFSVAQAQEFHLFTATGAEQVPAPYTAPLKMQPVV
ncbi:MotA/TolQ/ExbB proton channel family protein [Gibbsiella greigii]